MVPIMKLPPIVELQRRFAFDPETGDISCRETGRVIGHRTRAAEKQRGYVVVKVMLTRSKSLPVPAHRLAWALHHGEWPPEDIDHINRVRHDNRLVNLRCATRAQNIANSKLRRTNTSGVKGVSLQKARGKWRARLTKDGREVYYGYFSSKEEAIAARHHAARKFLGEFACESS